MKLVDAFLFFNELDLLEIRLHEMAPIVDHFVIVESLERFGSNKTKRPVLLDNWHRVKDFEQKIRYVLLEKLEPAFTDRSSAWAREYYSRNALLPPALELAGPNDAVIISDCDEIPRASAVRAALAALPKGIHRLNQSMYDFNVNQLIYGSEKAPHCWDMAIMGTARQIQEIGGPQKARFIFRHDAKTWYTKTHAVPNAGWHFTYFGGGVERMREKIESCCHFSDDEERVFLHKSPAQNLRDVVAGLAVRRETRRLEWRETNDPTLPQYFLDNVERFRHFTDAYYRDLLKGVQK